MPTIAEIIKSIELVAPLYLQEDYDNAGIQVGNASTEATSALLCLDVTDEIMSEAIEKGCNLIISHHPLQIGRASCRERVLRLVCISVLPVSM